MISCMQNYTLSDLVSIKVGHKSLILSTPFVSTVLDLMKLLTNILCLVERALPLDFLAVKYLVPVSDYWTLEKRQWRK